MQYTIVSKLPPNEAGAVWWHIKVGDKFFIVSANTVPYSGPETYVFPANELGEVTDWGELVGLRGTLDHKEAIAELFEYLSERDEEEDDTEIISESESYERFDDFLDELYATVRVCGYDYDPARVLKEIDPVAYREEYNNWLDNELNEGSFKLEQDL